MGRVPAGMMTTGSSVHTKSTVFGAERIVQERSIKRSRIVPNEGSCTCRCAVGEFCTVACAAQSRTSSRVKSASSGDLFWRASNISSASCHGIDDSPHRLRREVVERRTPARRANCLHRHEGEQSQTIVRGWQAPETNRPESVTRGAFDLLGEEVGLDSRWVDSIHVDPVVVCLGPRPSRVAGVGLAANQVEDLERPLLGTRVGEPGEQDLGHVVVPSRNVRHCSVASCPMIPSPNESIAQGLPQRSAGPTTTARFGA